MIARLYGGVSKFNTKACQGDDGFVEDHTDVKASGADPMIPSIPNVVGLHEQSQTNEALNHKECERRKRKMCPTTPADEEIRVCPRMLQSKDANLVEGSELGECSSDALKPVECDAIDPIEDVKSSKHELDLRPKEVRSKVPRPKWCWVYPSDNEEDLCKTIIRQEEHGIGNPSNVESLNKSNHDLLTSPTVVKVESSGCFPKLQDLKEKWETEMWRKSRRLEMALPLSEKKPLEPSKGETNEITLDIHDMKAQSSSEDSHVQLSSCFFSQPKHNKSKLVDESNAQNSTNMEVQGEKNQAFCGGMSLNNIEVENKASRVQENESNISQHILEQSNEGATKQRDFCLPMCLPKKDPRDEHVDMVKDLCSTSLSSNIADCNHNATTSATMLQTNSKKHSTESIKNNCSPMGIQPTSIFRISKCKDLMKVDNKKEGEVVRIPCWDPSNWCAKNTSSESNMEQVKLSELSRGSNCHVFPNTHEQIQGTKEQQILEALEKREIERRKNKGRCWSGCPEATQEDKEKIPNGMDEHKPSAICDVTILNQHSTQIVTSTTKLDHDDDEGTMKSIQNLQGPNVVQDHDKTMTKPEICKWYSPLDELYTIYKKSNESDTTRTKVGHEMIKACMESKPLGIEDQNAKKPSIESKDEKDVVLERTQAHSKQLKTIGTNDLQIQQKMNEPLESLGTINQDTNIVESTSIIDEGLENTKCKGNILKPTCWTGLCKATLEDIQGAHHEKEKKTPTLSTKRTISHTSLHDLMPLNSLDLQNVDIGTQDVKKLEQQEFDKPKQLKPKPMFGTCGWHSHVDKISTEAQVANTSETNSKEIRQEMMKPSMDLNILNAKKKVTEKPINESTSSIVEALEKRESERRKTKHYHWVGLCGANLKDPQRAHQGTNEEKHATTQTTNSIINLTKIQPHNALDHEGLENMIEDVQNCKGNKPDIQNTTKSNVCRQYSPSLDISTTDGKQTKTSDIKTLEPPKKPCIESKTSSTREQNINSSFDDSTKDIIKHMKEKKEEEKGFGACLRSLSPQSIRRAFKAYRRNNCTKESLETAILSPKTHDVAKLNVDTPNARSEINQPKTYGTKYSCLNLSPQSVRNSIQRQQSRHVDIIKNKNDGPLGIQRKLGETYFIGTDPSSTNPEYEVLRLVEEPNTATIEVGRKQSGISCWNPSLWSMQSSLKESQESNVDTTHCKDKLANEDHSKMLYPSAKSGCVSFIFPEVLGNTTSNGEVISDSINETMQSQTKKSKWSFCNSLLHTNQPSQTLDDESSNVTEEETSTSDGDPINNVDNPPNGASCCSVSPWSVYNSIKPSKRWEEGVGQSMVTHEYHDPNQSVDHMRNEKMYESPIESSYHDKHFLESTLQMSTSSAQNSMTSLGGCEKETIQSITRRNSTSERTMDDSNTLNELAQIRRDHKEESNAKTKGCWTQTLHNTKNLLSTVPSGCMQVSSLKSQGYEGGTYGTKTEIDSCSKTLKVVEPFNERTHDQPRKDPINESHGVKDGCWAQYPCNSYMLHSTVQSKFDPSRESKEEMEQTKPKIDTIDARNTSSMDPHSEQAYNDHLMPKDKKYGSLSLTNGCWTQPPCGSEKWESTSQMQKTSSDQDLTNITQNQSLQQPQEVVLS